MKHPSGVELLVLVHTALEESGDLDAVRTDYYWWHAPGQTPRQPQLFIMFEMDSLLVGGPPLLASTPVALPLPSQDEVTHLVKGTMAAMRQARRAVLS